ncbi:MAG: hypothetical protein WC787_04670 [Patescibacteria group bacterium]
MAKERIPLPYLQFDPSVSMTFSRVEDIIKKGEFVDWKPMATQLGQMGDGGKRRPAIYEFMCEMTDGLMALFRSKEYGIPQPFSRVSTASHGTRHASAFIVSHTGEFDLCPFSAERIHPDFGEGTLTAMLDGIPFLFVDPITRGTKGVRDLRKPMALEQAYLFDYIIGSGQRCESGLVVSEEGIVYDQYHHEAFSWSEDRRLEEAFRNSTKTISREFWNKLEAMLPGTFKAQRVKNTLTDTIGEEATEKMFSYLHKVFLDKYLGNVRILVGYG